MSLAFFLVWGLSLAKLCLEAKKIGLDLIHFLFLSLIFYLDVDLAFLNC